MCRERFVASSGWQMCWAYRAELRTRRNQFITETSSDYDEADADQAAGLLEQARRQK